MGTIIKLIEMRYRPADAPGQWTPLPPVPPGSATVNVPLEPGRQYVIQARSVAACGAVSRWIEINHTPANPSKAPKPPTHPAAEGMADGVHVSWTIGDKRANIVTEINWAYDVNNAPDETWFALPEASGASTIHRVTDGVERWYRMRHVDYLGNVSPWTASVKAKPKTVADGADITARNAVPNGIAVGGTLWADIFINTDTNGATNPGEVVYFDGPFSGEPLAAVKFQHPNGNHYTVISGDARTWTHFEGGLAEHDLGWLAFVGAEPERFPGALPNDLVLVKKIDDRWFYDNNSSWLPFETHEDDCIIAAVEHDAGDPAGISRIRRFAKRYDSYADGTAVDNLRPAEKGADPTGNHNSKGSDAHPYSGWVSPLDLRITYSKGVFFETIDAPTAIGLDASVGPGTVAIGMGGFDYPPGIALTFNSDAGVTWVRGERSENTWGPWSKQFNAGAGNRPDMSRGDVDHANMDNVANTANYHKVGAGYADDNGRVWNIWDKVGERVFGGDFIGDGATRARSGFNSGGRLKDERNTPVLIGWNRTNGAPDDNIITSADAGSSASINVSGHTRYCGFGNTAFPASSLGSGWLFERTVHVSMDPSDYSLAGHSYFGNYNPSAPLSNSQRAYIGPILTAKDGGGVVSGGGFPCLPATEMSDLKPGDMRPCMDNAGRFIGPRPLLADHGQTPAPCVLLVTEDGYGLPMSIGTPSLCGDGAQRQPLQMVGHTTAVARDGVNVWREIVRVVCLGELPVNRRSFGGISFSAPAWDLRGWRWWWWRLTSKPWRRSAHYEIFSHNMKP